MMRNGIRTFLRIVLIGLFMVGCSSVQPTTIGTVTVFKPTAKFTSIPTLIPTLIPLPTFVVPPTATLTPLPKGIFDPFLKEFHEITIRMGFGSVSSGGEVEEQVLIDSAIGWINFSISWREGDLDLTLVQPDGNVVDPSIAVPIQNDTVYLKDRISFSSKSYEEYYVVGAPQPGIWKMRISGKTTPITGSDYILEAWASVGGARVSANFDKGHYSSGDPIKLSASIEDSISAASTEPEYLHGVTMQVVVEDPARIQYSFELFDDGIHGDGRADDGVYANTFDSTLLAGEYNFYIQISGLNHRRSMSIDGVGEPFTRIYFRSTVVH